MTVVTIRPDSTTASSGTSLTGAASIHAALNDDSDSSYVVTAADTNYYKVGFDNPTLPAGALLTRISLRLRCAVNSASKHYQLDFSGLLEGLTVNWTTPTTVTVTPSVFSALALPVDGLDMTGLNDSYLQVNGSGTGAIVQLKSYEAFYDFTVVEQPVTVVSAPSGTVTTSNKPLVSWSNTLDADGGAQARYEVKVFSAAQYGAGGFDPDTSTATASSGVVSSAAGSWQMTTVLPDDDYRAYVRVAQSVNGSLHWSDWEYEAFEIDVDVPDPPSLVVIAHDEHGCIELDIAADGGAATTDAFELQRSLDGGLTWEPVRLPAYV